MVFGLGRKNAPKKPGIFKLNIGFTELMILVILSLIIVQALALIFEPFVDINLGPVFILIAISMSAATSMAVFKKLLSNTQVTKQDIFAIIITALLALVVLFFLRDFVPEIFEQSISQLQSMVGF